MTGVEAADGPCCAEGPGRRTEGRGAAGSERGPPHAEGPGSLRGTLDLRQRRKICKLHVLILFSHRYFGDKIQTVFAEEDFQLYR